MIMHIYIFDILNRIYSQSVYRSILIKLKSNLTFKKAWLYICLNAKLTNKRNS